jgi:hypothetical protein
MCHAPVFGCLCVLLFDGRVTRVLVMFMGIITLVCLSFFFPQVKTRVQLECEKTSTSLLGSFRSIIREEGGVHYDSRLSLRQPNSGLFVCIASDVSTTVGGDPQIRHDDYDSTRCQKVSFLHCFSKHRNVPPNCASLSPSIYRPPSSHVITLCQLSAANDFWGKTFRAMSGEAEMIRQLSIVTGCSAGATEGFVVVPFELVKIKYTVSPRSLSHVDVFRPGDDG